MKISRILCESHFLSNCVRLVSEKCGCMFTVILSSFFHADSVLKHYETQVLKEKSSYSGLAESQRREVEDLLLEGDLLEVTTDETTQLWQVLQSDTECVNYFSLSEEAAANYEMPRAGLWRKVSMKRKLSS